jgi:ABC-type transport system involved in cytochrome c biogenesis ATPase subunit/GNAT superfamily N-acetyltransferase
MTRRKEHFRITKLKRTYNRHTNTFTFNISYETAPATLTDRTKQVAEAFGLGTDQTRQFTLYDNAAIKIRPTDIVLITGDSGSGKSALLKAIKTDLGNEAQDAKDIPIDPNQHIIETIGNNTTEAIETLSKVGLNDAFLFLRPCTQLSDGQKHRYQIALLTASQKPFWILDEFTSTLDRDTAKILAFNLQKQARKLGKAVIAATTQTDLLKDYAPNVHIHKRYGKEVTIRYYPKAKAATCSLTRQMTIQQGTLQDYKALSQFHYRQGQCPPPRKIFVLKRKDETCGVAVYGFPSPMCFGRSKVWKGNLQQLQRQISIISRVVVHPKYRSIGLGAKLVSETLAHAGTPCVEAVAVMAKYNPFFEKAGMQRIAESKPSQHVTSTLERLGELGFDCALLAGVVYGERVVCEVGREAVLDVLETLSKRDAAVRRRLVCLRNVYPKHEEFVAKVAELDLHGLALALKRLSFMAQTKVYLFWRKEQAG